MTHICVSKLSIIGSDNGLSPGRRQAIIWTNAGILLIWTLGANFSDVWSEIHAFSFKKMHLKMASAKWRPFCLGLKVLKAFLAKLHWSPPSAAYMPQWTGSSMFQVKACRLFSTKPLPEPILAECQLDSLEQISVIFKSEFYHFLSINAFQNVVCQNGGHFV